jgi:hypothetical protein
VWEGGAHEAPGPALRDACVGHASQGPHAAPMLSQPGPQTRRQPVSHHQGQRGRCSGSGDMCRQGLLPPELGAVPLKRGWAEPDFRTQELPRCSLNPGPKPLICLHFPMLAKGTLGAHLRRRAPSCWHPPGASPSAPGPSAQTAQGPWSTSAAAHWCRSQRRLSCRASGRRTWREVGKVEKHLTQAARAGRKRQHGLGRPLPRDTLRTPDTAGRRVPAPDNSIPGS